MGAVKKFMDKEESMEAISVDEETLETPSEQPETTDTPTEEEETETTTEEPEVKEEEQLFELPDGRKVDSETLAREWKENFMPDYTKKSQTLAEYEKINSNKKVTDNDKFSDPNYVPQTYGELIEEAERRALEKIEMREQERIQQHKALEEEITSQLQELKKGDPNLNENALFLHATKYGFRDLPTAYQNMKDMNKLVKTVQTETVKNISKRNDDPVSTSKKSSGSTPDPTNFESAIDYYRSLQ